MLIKKCSYRKNIETRKVKKKENSSLQSNNKRKKKLSFWRKY